MRWIAAFFALLLLPMAAQAANRTYSIGSFDRIRVDGPFEVHLETGKPPGAKATGDQRTLDELSIAVEGTTLIVRMGVSGWGEQASRASTAPVITLSTPNLRRVNVNAGARLTIDKMTGQRVDVAINGSGALAVAAIDADRLNATIIGTGSIALAGRAARAQLFTNGPGAIDAAALKVSDLTVRLDGTGDIHAFARYTANITTTGLGKVTVDGSPACIVSAIAGGPVVCGAGLAPS